MEVCEGKCQSRDLGTQLAGSDAGFQLLTPNFSFTVVAWSVLAVWPHEQQNETGNDSLDPTLEVWVWGDGSVVKAFARQV